MTRKRLLKWVGLVLAASVLAAFLIPFTRQAIIGLINGERFYRGRPTSYWLESLRDGKTHEKAKKQLQEGGLKAVPVLCAIMQDQQERKGQGIDVWVEAMSILSELTEAIERDGFGATPYLLELLEDKDRHVRMWALVTLGRIGPPARRALPRLQTLLNTAEGEYRMNLARAIWRIEPNVRNRDVLLQELLWGMKQERPAMRAIAARALGEMGTAAESALHVLDVALSDPSADVRVNAAIALWRIEGKAAIVVDSLIEALESESAHVRHTAMHGLEEIGPNARDAVPALIKVLKREDRSSWDRTRAGWALEKIDPEAAKKAGVP